MDSLGSELSCGITELFGFPYDKNRPSKKHLKELEEEIIAKIRYFASKDKARYFLACVTSKQKKSMKILENIGFKHIESFINARTKIKNHIYRFYMEKTGGAVKFNDDKEYNKAFPNDYHW